MRRCINARFGGRLANDNMWNGFDKGTNYWSAELRAELASDLLDIGHEFNFGIRRVTQTLDFCTDSQYIARDVGTGQDGPSKLRAL